MWKGSTVDLNWLDVSCVCYKNNIVCYSEFKKDDKDIKKYGGK